MSWRWGPGVKAKGTAVLGPPAFCLSSLSPCFTPFYRQGAADGPEGPGLPELSQLSGIDGGAQFPGSSSARRMERGG